MRVIIIAQRKIRTQPAEPVQQLHFKILKIYPRVILSIIKSRWANKVVQMLDKRKRSKLDFSKLFSCLRYCIYYIPILQLYWFSENLSAVSQVSAFISSNLIRTSKIIFLCKKNGEIYVLRLHKKISWNITSRYLTVLRRKCRLREFDQREVFIFFYLNQHSLEDKWEFATSTQQQCKKSLGFISEEI